MSKEFPIKVEMLPAAKRYFKAIRKNKRLLAIFKETIVALQHNPYKGKENKGDLQGIYSIDIYHHRVNYELAYKIDINDEERILLIILAGTRENFYKELKRYIKK